MKILVVYKKSMWELYQGSTDPQIVKFLGNPAEIERLKGSHDRQHANRAWLKETLLRLGHQATWQYRALPIQETPYDLIIAFGGDGTFIEVAHSIHTTPLLGINSDPQTSTGHFMAGSAQEIGTLLTEAQPTSIARAQAYIDNQPIGGPILNDVLYAHRNPAACTRYRYGNENVSEHKNSGLLISTGAGSTAWAYQEGGTPYPHHDQRLQVVHRGDRAMPITQQDEVIFQAMTRQGTLYIDGAHHPIKVPLGETLKIANTVSLKTFAKL